MNSQTTQTNSEELKSKVNLYLEVQRFDAAEKLIQSSLVKFPNDEVLHNLLGLVFHKQSRFSDAIKQFRLSLEKNSTYIEAAQNLISTLCDVSQYDDARALYLKIRDQLIDHKRHIPKHLVNQLAIKHRATGDSYLRCGFLEDAIQEYRNSINLFPADWKTKIALAKVYLKLGSLDQAKSLLEETLSLLPVCAEAHNLLGLVSHQQNRHENAKLHWSKSAELDENDLVSRMCLRTLIS